MSTYENSFMSKNEYDQYLINDKNKYIDYICFKIGTLFSQYIKAHGKHQRCHSCHDDVIIIHICLDECESELMSTQLSLLKCLIEKQGWEVVQIALVKKQLTITVK
ncbi:MAG: hypothetical protein KC589_06385 [Nanoarchaeota archaeon]|nr:hypothetical protein [Nanoarchaeota archaeon]